MPQPRMPIGWPRGYLVSILATAALLGLALLTPWLVPGWRLGLMEFFSMLCHQDPARSFTANSHPLGVCHRCIGIYVGLVSGALIYPALHRALEKRMRAVVIGLSVPMAVDWGIDVLGLWANTPLSRVTSGTLFGMALGLALTLGLVDIFKRTRDVQPHTSSCEGTA